MFSFANPEYLYLLLLLPVVAGLFWLSQRAKAMKIAKFGRAGVVKGLMPEQSKYKPWIRLMVELVLLATIVVILARPRGGAQETNTTMKGIEVMICLDVSNSMNAASDDDAPDVSRLQRSKQVLEKLIDRITGNKVGLIVFAGNAYMQMPITGDAQSAKMYLSSINTDMVPTQGTAIGAAINMACQCFSSNPRTQKTIIVITDGENFEDDAVSSAEDARKKGISVNVVGIGAYSRRRGADRRERQPCHFKTQRKRRDGNCQGWQGRVCERCGKRCRGCAQRPVDETLENRPRQLQLFT